MSDEDLLKVCSEAAVHLGAERVMEVLNEGFNVKKVHELEGTDRTAFTKRLDVEVENTTNG